MLTNHAGLFLTFLSELLWTRMCPFNAGVLRKECPHRLHVKLPSDFLRFDVVDPVLFVLFERTVDALNTTNFLVHNATDKLQLMKLSGMNLP